MKIIVTKLAKHYQQYCQSYRKPYDQSACIDEGVEFVSEQVSPGDPQIIYEHGSSLWCIKKAKKMPD